jgi:hypothetical protein
MKKQEGFSARFTRHPEGKISKPYFLEAEVYALFVKCVLLKIN